MSYTPTNWKAGDVITSEKLNKLENGVANAGGGVLVVNISRTETGAIMDKTAAEVFEACENGAAAFRLINDSDSKIVPLLSNYNTNDGAYQFVIHPSLIYLENFITFTAASGDDYPDALM